MNLPNIPHSDKKRIIVVGLALLLAVSTVLLVLMLTSGQQNPTSATTVTTIEAQDLRLDDQLDPGFTRAQLGDPATAASVDHFILYDIRPAEAYQQSHIEGATSVPVAWLDRSNVPADTAVVVYSQDQAELDQAVTILQQKQVKLVRTLAEPLAALKELGYAVYGLE